MNIYDVRHLVEQYACGNFEHLSTTEEGELGNNLFNNLQNLDDLIPMLRSPFKTAMWRACYIVSETSADTSGIFQYVTPLIHSEWATIRDIACECYRWNIRTAEQVAEVIKLLEDTDRAVRLTATITIRDFAIAGSRTLIPSAIKRLRLDGSFELANAVEKFLLPALPASLLRPVNIRNESRVNKLCCYISAQKAGLRGKHLARFARALDEPDLLFFHGR